MPLSWNILVTSGDQSPNKAIWQKMRWESQVCNGWCSTKEGSLKLKDSLIQVQLTVWYSGIFWLDFLGRSNPMFDILWLDFLGRSVGETWTNVWITRGRKEPWHSRWEHSICCACWKKTELFQLRLLHHNLSSCGGYKTTNQVRGWSWNAGRSFQSRLVVTTDRQFPLLS